MSWRALLHRGLEVLGRERRLDVERLLAEVRGGGRALLLAHLDEATPEAACAIVERQLERLQEGEPIQYVLGHAPFWDMELAVTPSVLIPRFDTEALVERAVFHAQAMDAPALCDICTGSGAIACALARALPDAAVAASDLSVEALAVAETNRRRWAPEVLLREGDLFAPWQGQVFDLITANPPYISEAEMESLDDHVRREPTLALAAGIDGLDLYRRLIPEAQRFLRPGGWLVVEIGCAQGPAVRALFAEAGYQEIAVHADPGGLDRVVEGRIAIVD